MSAFIKSIFFRVIFFKSVITMFEDELVNKSLNLCKKMKFKLITVTTLTSYPEGWLKKILKQGTKGLDIDSNLSLYLLNYRRLHKNHL